MKTSEELSTLARSALKACPAEEVEVWVRARGESHLRFAGGGVTRAGTSEVITVEVTAAWGARAATASTTEITAEGIGRAARSASDLARLVPPSEERLSAVGPQRYPSGGWWDASTGRSSPESREARVATVLEVARAADLLAAGALTEQESLTVFQDNRGAVGMGRSTVARLSATLRTPDGKQSGWAAQTSVRVADLDSHALATRAAEKALRWKDPAELAPGRYTTVLEPAAVGELLGPLFASLDRRAADEGRSAFSRPEGGARIGETLFSPLLGLVSDPADRLVPGSPFGEGGLAARRLAVVERGRLVDLVTSRYWARTRKLPVTPCCAAWRLEGAAPLPSGEALLAGVERGILVSRVSCVRPVEPQTLTVTGLTRDATFLVENGKVTGPVKNFRFNQSLLDLLRDVDATGPVELVEQGGVPALRVKEVGYSALSEAV